MSRPAFILGNGRSRLQVDLPRLAELGLVVGCNAIYREFTPHLLVSVDPKMEDEILPTSPKCLYYHAARRSRTRKIFRNGEETEIRDRGWASGATAGYLTVCLYPAVRRFFLVGHDLYSQDKHVNDVYAGTPNYRPIDGNPQSFRQWIRQWDQLFKERPDLSWTWVRPWSDAPTPVEWKPHPNFSVVELENFVRAVDNGWF